MKLPKLGLFLSLAILSATAHAATYEVRIKCPQNPNVTNTHYISADSDLEAQNEASRMLESRTDYRGKGCQVVSIKRS